MGLGLGLMFLTASAMALWEQTYITSILLGRMWCQTFDTYEDVICARCTVPDVIWRGAAAAADDVDESGLGKVADVGGSLLGGLVVRAEGVRQA